MIRAAIIGAGAAGLCCARHLAKHTDKFFIKVYEQTGEIGGTWVYTDSTGVDERTGLPIHTSMYRNLRTNLPKEIMAFPGFPFPNHLPSFVHHSEMLKYLQDYAMHYDLEQYINFHTQVVKVAPVILPGEERRVELDNCLWEVTSQQVPSGVETCEIFDVVIVCNGHYFLPYHNILGLSNFMGPLIHSHDYRYPEPYQDKNILIIGAKQSGIDIGLEVSRTASHVYLSHRNPKYVNFPKNIEQVPAVSSIRDSGIVKLENGTELMDVDAIILCTGYEYNFPFLDEECGITVTNHRVHPLYKHLVNPLYPSMLLVGLHFTVLPFPYFEMQANFILSVILGRHKLPIQEEMTRQDKEEYTSRLDRGLSPRHAHFLGGEQWKYVSDLATLGQFEGLDPVLESLYTEVCIVRKKDICNYKNYNYRLVDKERWEEVN